MTEGETRMLVEAVDFYIKNQSFPQGSDDMALFGHLLDMLLHRLWFLEYLRQQEVNGPR